MSASTGLMHELTYQEQLKLARAEIVVAWAARVVDQGLGLLRIEPAAFAADEAEARRQSWYGCVY